MYKYVKIVSKCEAYYVVVNPSPKIRSTVNQSVTKRPAIAAQWPSESPVGVASPHPTPDAAAASSGSATPTWPGAPPVSFLLTIWFP